MSGSLPSVSMPSFDRAREKFLSSQRWARTSRDETYSLTLPSCPVSPPGSRVSPASPLERCLQQEVLSPTAEAMAQHLHRFHLPLEQCRQELLTLLRSPDASVRADPSMVLLWRQLLQTLLGPSSTQEVTSAEVATAPRSSDRQVNFDALSAHVTADDFVAPLDFARTLGSAPAFDWPVVDMAAFEYGDAAKQHHGSLSNLVVVVGLPQVGGLLIEELRALLRDQLLPLIGPVALVHIPTHTSNGHTKGCAFLELEESSQCRALLLALQGFTWGPGRILEARWFSHYGDAGAETGSTALDEASTTETMDSSRSEPSTCASSISGMQSIQSVQSVPEPLRLSLPRLLGSPARNHGSDRIPSRAGAEDGHAECAACAAAVDARLAALTASLQSQRGSGLSNELGALESQLSLAVSRGAISAIRKVESHISHTYQAAAEAGCRPLQFDSPCAGGLPGIAAATEAEAAAAAAAGVTQSSKAHTCSYLDGCGSSPLRERKLWQVCLAAERLRSSSLLLRLRQAGGRWRAHWDELRSKASEVAGLKVLLGEQMQQALDSSEELEERWKLKMEKQRQVLEDHFRQQIRESESEKELLLDRVDSLELQVECLTAERQRALASSSAQGHGNCSGSAAALGLSTNLSDTSEATLDETEKQLLEHLDQIRAAKRELIQREKEQLEEQKLCCVCQTEEKSVMLLPCSHLCVCQHCSLHEMLTKCPICRSVVQATHIVYS